MFSIEHLNNLREQELSQLLPHLLGKGRILEIGGGSGIQAKRLSEAGCDIVSVDVRDSGYADDRVFPVIDYDGHRLPFPDDSFDVVFSSNVLEHIPHLDDFQVEIKRVLRSGGYCIHVMPTGVWRFWTSVAHYVEFGQRVAQVVWQMLPRTLSSRLILSNTRNCIGQLAGLGKAYLYPPRHGETGNALTEIYTFSRHYWIRHFERNGYEVEEASPMRLFYTGHMVLGKHWSMSSRQSTSRILGSACVLYRVRPGIGSR